MKEKDESEEKIKLKDNELMFMNQNDIRCLELVLTKVSSMAAMCEFDELDKLERLTTLSLALATNLCYLRKQNIQSDIDEMDLYNMLFSLRGKE